MTDKNKRKKKEKEQKKSMSCIDGFKKAIFGAVKGGVQFIKYEEQIIVETIIGVIFGPHSITFK